jgi:hypothetical protein
MDEPIEEKAELDHEKSPPSAVFAGSTRRKGRWILLVLLLLGGVIGFYSFRRQAKEQGGNCEVTTITSGRFSYNGGSAEGQHRCFRQCIRFRNAALHRNGNESRRRTTDERQLS